MFHVEYVKVCKKVLEMDWENTSEAEKKRLADELLAEAQTFKKKGKIEIYKEILKNFLDVIKVALDKNSGLTLTTALKLINEKAESTIDRATLYNFISENHLRDAEEKHETSTQVKKVRKSLSPEEVFKFKEEHSEMTNDEIAKHFNVSSRTIRKKIQPYKDNLK